LKAYRESEKTSNRREGCKEKKVLQVDLLGRKLMEVAHFVSSNRKTNNDQV